MMIHCAYLIILGLQEWLRSDTDGNIPPPTNMLFALSSVTEPFGLISSEI